MLLILLKGKASIDRLLSTITSDEVIQRTPEMCFIKSTSFPMREDMAQAKSPALELLEIAVGMGAQEMTILSRVSRKGDKSSGEPC